MIAIAACFVPFAAAGRGGWANLHSTLSGFSA
jgi:hypothetical protein